MRMIPFRKSRPTVAVIRLSGVIAQTRNGLSDAALAPVIEKAFRKGKPAAVALSISSPGGSPVQSSLIAARIRRLSQDHSVPVVAFVEDVAASGGYWLACAADEIHADESSVVGSIGVISASFGFDQLLERHGVKRRVHTSGASKSFMDPFLPENPEDVRRLKALQDPIHRAFIDYVKARRGTRLTQDQPLFGGEIFVGRQAQEAGLIDGIAHLVPAMRQRFGEKVRFRRYGPKKGLLSMFGAHLAEGVAQQAAERAAYARFGL